MALPAHVLERLPQELLRGARPLTGPLSGSLGGHLSIGAEAPREGLPLGLEALDSLLPDGGLLRGGVVELMVQGASALGTSLALAACRAAQEESRLAGGETAWCAFVDPSATLYGPGVARSGVDLSRLLVVRPEVEDLSRVALRVTESQAFSIVVIDTVGSPSNPLEIHLGAWNRVVRRLSMAVDDSSSTVLLLTDKNTPRPLTLPVAQRIELCRKKERELLLSVAKDRRGRVFSARPVAWTRASRKKSDAA